MGYLKLGKVIKKEFDDKVRVTLPVYLGQNVEKEIWYETDRKYSPYLYTDRIDPFLIAILPYCMKNEVSIFVDELTGCSKELLWQIKEYLIPSLLDSNAEYKSIDILCNAIDKELEKGEKIAVGISRGVDSLYAFKKVMAGTFKPDTMVLFNTQAYGMFGGNASTKMFERDRETADKFCAEARKYYHDSFELLSVSSNIQEVFKIETYYAGSYRDAGAIVFMKSYIKLYYFASTNTMEEFTLAKSCREGDPWIFSCLSDTVQHIQIVGSDKTRMDKVKEIADYPLSYQFLNVCERPLLEGSDNKLYDYNKNCTHLCDKCRCTISALMAIGKIDKYYAVFDMEWIKANKKKLLFEVVRLQKQIGAWDYSETYQLMRENGMIDDTCEIEAGMAYGFIDDSPSDKDSRILEVMDRMIQKIQNCEFPLKDILRENGYRSVGIYGMGRIGRVLCHELEGMVKVEIDRNSETRESICKPNNDFSELDLIIITVAYKEDMIANYLRARNKCTVVTMAELFSMWN